jgi:hypothetical protein
MIELQQMIDSPQWEQRSKTKAALKAEVEAILSTPPARPRSTGIPWAALALGAVIGGAVVAIALWGL